MRTVIFLDIDGVIATRESYSEGKHLSDISCRLDRRPIRWLNKLSLCLKADIVISSSWRRQGIDYIRTLFQSAGVAAPVIGVTSETGRHKGKQILKWMKDNKYEGDYVVIDDDSFDIVGTIPSKNFIHTKDGRANGGLTQAHIIDYFKRQNEKTSN